jgi:hypothetical protein
MNYRDLQNISNLSQQILVEGANEEHNVLNRWPYTSPYLQDDIMEKEDSPYEKASDAALDARYGYGRATGPKTSFGRAANRASAAAMLRRLRRDRDEGRTTSRESGADAVHQGWAHTARTSSDQTPEKKERRAKLADTPYSQLPNDEQEKDRVSADAVRALYNRRNQREDFDLYDIILSHLLDEGYAETQEQAEVIMVNMSEDWRESIMLEQSLPSNYTDYKSPSVQAAHARSMGSASRMRQMGMNATSVDPEDDAQSNLNAVKSGSGVAKPLSGTTIRSGAGKGFKVGDPGIDIRPNN